MPKGQKLSRKQTLFVMEYLQNGQNAYKAAIAAGYADTTSRIHSHKFVRMPVIKAALEREMEARRAKSEYTIKEAAARIDAVIANVEASAAKGSLAANQVILTALREYNDIHGLHKQRHIDETPEQRQLDEHQQQEAREAARMRIIQITGRDDHGIIQQGQEGPQDAVGSPNGTKGAEAI